MSGRDDHMAAADVVKAAGRVARDVARASGRLRTGAKTRKSAATREKIMAAASGLMVERGSTSFQMSEVSERCHMSKGSLYYYFSDRAELVRAVFDQEIDRLVAQVEDIVGRAPTATDSIFELVSALAAAVRPGQLLSLATSQARVTRDGRVLSDAGGHLARIVSVLTAQFERAKGEGLVRPDVDSALGAMAIAGAFLAFEYSAAQGEDGPGLVREILDLVFSGMGTASARELFSAGPRDASAGAGASRAPAPVAQTQSLPGKDS